MDRSFVTPPDRERNAFFASLVERATDTVVTALGPDEIEALLLIGAPARGDATVAKTDDGWASLSDVDLVCLTSPTADERALSARLGPALAELNGKLAGISPGVDVGFKTHADLASPAPYISNYECLLSPLVVWGNERAIEGVAPPDIRSIPPAESLRLAHNRIVETLLARRDLEAAASERSTALRVLYRIAKLALDGATALLYLARKVPPTYAARVEAFEREMGGRRTEPALESFRPDLAAWAAFKSTADPEALRALPELSDAAPETAARRVWLRYAGYAESIWRLTLGATVDADLRGSEMSLVAAQYRRLESPAKRAGRAFRIVRGGAAPSGLFSPWRVLAGAPLASPMNLAYLTGVIIYAGHRDGAPREWIDREIRTRCPFRLPPGFGELPEERRLDVIVDRLALFHETMLLGRKAGMTT